MKNKNQQFKPIAIKIHNKADLNIVNELYDNQFNYMDEYMFPCYALIAGFSCSDMSYITEDTCNKKEILKDYRIITPAMAQKSHIEIPEKIKEANRKSREEIDNLFSRI